MDEAVSVSAVSLDHDVNIINIESSGCDISCHQDEVGLDITILLETGFTLALLQISVQGQELGIIQRLEALSILLRLSEYYDLLVTVSLDKGLDMVHLISETFSEDSSVLNLLWNLSHIIAHQVNHDWVVHSLLG